MRFGYLAVLALLMFPSLAFAGYTADNCRGDVNRVRADMVFDLKTGHVIAEENAGAKFHPASLSKLMSLMVIFDAIETRELRYGDRIPLVRSGGTLDNRTGMIKSMTVKEAIGGIVTGSLNNPIDGIAQKIGSGEFVRRMNAKARSLGLTKTKFVNVTGMPTVDSKRSQRTNLRELATIVRHLETEYHDQYSDFDGKASVTIRGVPAPLKSTNNLLQNASSRRAKPYKGVVGGKTGYTCYSGWHLVALYKDPSSPKNRLVLMTVGHDTGNGRDNHMRELLDENIPKYKRFLAAETKGTDTKPANPEELPHPRENFENNHLVRADADIVRPPN